MACITQPKIKCGDCQKLRKTFGGTFHICEKRSGQYLNPEAARYCINFQKKEAEKPEPFNKGECKRCHLQADALSIDGYCMACTGEILREKFPNLNMEFVGDMAELANKQKEA